MLFITCTEDLWEKLFQVAFDRHQVHYLAALSCLKWQTSFHLSLLWTKSLLGGAFYLPRNMLRNFTANENLHNFTNHTEKNIWSHFSVWKSFECYEIIGWATVVKQDGWLDHEQENHPKFVSYLVRHLCHLVSQNARTVYRIIMQQQHAQ